MQLRQSINWRMENINNMFEMGKKMMAGYGKKKKTFWDCSALCSVFSKIYKERKGLRDPLEKPLNIIKRK